MKTRFQLGVFDPPETVAPAQTPDSERVLLGNYNGTPSRSTTALDGIRKQFPKAQILFEPGTTFLRPNELVPTSVLTTASGEPGLTAEVFTKNDFSDEPIETRTDPQVAVGGRMLDFLSAPPTTPARPTRWTGFLTPNVSGTHRLGLEGFGNRLYLDGALLIDATRGFGAAGIKEIDLEKGRKYAITIDSVPLPVVPPRAMVRFVWREAMPDARERAVEAARQADVVVAVVGITSELEGEEMRIDIPGFKGVTARASICPRKSRTSWKP